MSRQVIQLEPNTPAKFSPVVLDEYQRKLLAISPAGRGPAFLTKGRGYEAW